MLLDLLYEITWGAVTPSRQDEAPKVFGMVITSHLRSSHASEIFSRYEVFGPF
jgi:hypothetical protein